MKRNKKTMKYIPELWWYEGEDGTELTCIYVIGYYDKYGLHYQHSDNAPYNNENVRLKGKKYRKAPFAFDSHDKMIEGLKEFDARTKRLEEKGDIRKEAVYLCLDLDEDGVLKSDPFDMRGYVSKRGTIFNIVDDAWIDGNKKRFKLTKDDKKLVFPDFGKAADYVLKNYGWE